MNRTLVKSSFIKAIGYDPASQSLEVEFTTGALYQYEGVSPEEHHSLINADSISKHYAAHIRGKFDHKRDKASS